jgi:anaphase-promoting complex subunit 2
LEDNQQSQEEQDADELAALLVNDDGGVASGTKNIAKNDTMSLLIGVYGGKDSFLSEYREMLASRLVSVASFEIDREIASLELMKSKFSESIDSSSSEALTHCSVMIKDLVESKKLNQRIKADLSSSRKIKHSNLLTMLVKSAHFWPNKSSSTSESSEHETAQQQYPFLPEPIRDAMAEFERKFTELKPTQKIEWLRCEGVVTFSVLLRGKDTEFRLSPIYVEVLSLFEPLGLPKSVPTSTQPAACLAPTNVTVCLSLESIASGVSLSADQVKPVVQFWVSKGILREIEINKFSTLDE